MEKALKTMTPEFCGTGRYKLSVEKLFETDNVLFLDIRYKTEVKSLHFDFEIFGFPTLNILIDELPERLNEIPKDKLIAYFCLLGMRSAWAYIYNIFERLSSKIDRSI